MFESAGRNLHCKVIHPEISMELWIIVFVVLLYLL